MLQITFKLYNLEIILTFKLCNLEFFLLLNYAF